jgi:hypothetical protein
MTTYEGAMLADYMTESTACEDLNFEILGPISRSERILCYYIAKMMYTGYGSFVELGSFLGASTQAFAAGLKHNRIVGDESTKIIKTLDLFRYDSHWDNTYQSQVLSATDKVDFLPRFKRNLRGYEAYYQAYRNDITHVTSMRDDEQDIEILFCDLAKTESIMIHVASHFISKIPIGGYYIQQDYLFPGLPFIKAFHEYFWEYFQIEQIVAPSVLFRMKKKFDAGRDALEAYKALTYRAKRDLIMSNRIRFEAVHGDHFKIVELPIEFDEKTYLALHKDVADAGVDPVQHYLIHGYREGRRLR